MRKLTILFTALTLTAGLWAETQTVSYLSPVYNTEGVATSGIQEWETETVEATVVTNATATVTWNAGWYVVTGTDVTLSKGAVCNGAVRLILADGAKLTAKGYDVNHTPGIQVSGEGNSLTIYAQSTDAATMGQLIANGGSSAAGIGGGYQQSGSNITINGGKVTANGGTYGAGIGGESGFNITINCGEVTATGGSVASSCIGGSGSGSGLGSTNIKIATRLQIKAGMNNPPTMVIGNTGGDLAISLRGMQYAVLHDLLPDTKEAAIAAIDAAIVGVTDETILAIATQAKPNINNATTIESVNSIKDKALAKINAIAEIEAAIVGVTDETILAIATQAKTDINAATTKEDVVAIKTLSLAKINAIAKIKAEGQGIQNEFINNWINAAIHDISQPGTDTEEEINNIRDKVLDLIYAFKDGKTEGDAAGYARGKAEGIEEGDAAGYARGQAEAYGTMGTPCTDCTAVEVTDGTTTVKLYKPTKVRYIKVPSEE